MVHLRLNEAESNPNPHINFITSLPSYENEYQEEARQLLRALAAQVRPVMKSHGFVVNSFEEYEHNKVFLGRNWNNGETVEIVLRGPHGTFYPTALLMSTLCHELAHIKHMNHGPGFQALWKQLRTEVRQLQDKGYYGDGYWSAGTRLSDSARIPGQGIEAGFMPEYMCGGAQSRMRPTSLRRRRGPTGKRREIVPSLHTGAQTAKKRKTGARVTSKYAFTGEGMALADDAAGSKAAGKGKRAGSKRAREERALAIERRLQALQTISKPSELSSSKTQEEEEYDSDDDEVEIVGETDTERRERLLSSESSGNLGSLKFGGTISWEDFEDDFNFAKAGDGCDVPVASGSTFTTGTLPQGGDIKGKMKEEPRPGVPSTWTKSTPISTGKTLGIGKLVQSEIDLRKKESLGMAPIKSGGRTLGGRSQLDTKQKNSRQSSTKPEEPGHAKWPCLVCTLDNKPDHLACAACATSRGEQIYST